MFLHFHQNKILPKDLKLNIRTKGEQNKNILARTGKLLLEERISLNHVISDRFKNIVEPLKSKILESTTPQEFHLV